MFRFKGEPFRAGDWVWCVGAMVELRSGRHRGEEEGHAIVIQRRAPLSHRGVDGVEDVIGTVIDMIGIRIGDSRRQAGQESQRGLDSHGA